MQCLTAHSVYLREEENHVSWFMTQYAPCTYRRMNFSHDLWALRLWAVQSRWWKLSPCCKTGLTVTDKLTWWRWRMRSTIFLLHNGAPPDWTRHVCHKLLSEAGFRKVWFEQFHRGNMWTWMLVSWLSAFSFLLFNLCSLSALAFISSIFLQTTSKNLLSWFLYKNPLPAP